MLEYELKRSQRKTLAIYVRQDGRVEVRAPLGTGRAYIEDFVSKKLTWIERTRNKLAFHRSSKQILRLTQKEEALYKKRAKMIFRQKCLFFSEIMGLRPGEIKVSSARTRWGSCNRRGDISLAYRLLFVPEELMDYVVVHELAHLKEMNHSQAFWSVVEQILPDYKARRQRLREYERQYELIII